MSRKKETVEGFICGTNEDDVRFRLDHIGDDYVDVAYNATKFIHRHFPESPKNEEKERPEEPGSDFGPDYRINRYARRGKDGLNFGRASVVEHTDLDGEISLEVERDRPRHSLEIYPSNTVIID